MNSEEKNGEGGAAEVVAERVRLDGGAGEGQVARERRLVLQPRDRELLGHTAIARYLSESQIRTLVFRKAVRAEMRRDGRTGELALGGVRNRLAQLCRAGENSPLRQLAYRDENGTWRKAYCVTMYGYALARTHLRQTLMAPPPERAGDPHIAHTIALNDLYVGLAASHARSAGTSRAGANARASEQPFGWTAESVQLPWQEFNSRRGENETRRLVPDGILDLPEARLRVFVECEMGGHPIVRQARSDADSILSKVRRYASFVHTPGESSNYASRFTDGWMPELLILVRTDDRAKSVEGVLSAWREEHPRHPLVVRALALRSALAEYAPRVGLPAPARPPIEVDPNDLKVLLASCEHSLASMKTMRRFGEANPGLSGFPKPHYTPEIRQAHDEIIPRLRKALAEACK